MARILIIDDDEMDLEFLRLLLDREGHTLLLTADGPRGIDLHAEYSPDLVLLDLGLPSMNGLQVLKEIRAADPRAKVIVITGYGSVEAAVAAMRYGALDFVEKTYDTDFLLQKIEAVLRPSAKKP